MKHKLTPLRLEILMYSLKNKSLSEMGQLVKFRGWEFRDWESFKTHAEVVGQLKKIVKSRYQYLKLLKFDKKEACIAQRHGQKPLCYVAHTPDLIIADTEKLKDRIFIAYVNTLGRNRQNFLRDLRGMLALSTVLKSYRGFVLTIRHSIFTESWSTTLPSDSPVEIMSLKSLLFALDMFYLEIALHFLFEVNFCRS